MQNTINEEQLLVAKIRLLGFSQTPTITKLKQAIEENPNMMSSLESLINSRKHKDYELSHSQISKIALSAHGTENLNAFKLYYPQLKKKGFELEKLFDIIDIHEPYMMFPILLDTIHELKPKGWSDKSIQKLFYLIPNFEKIDLLKQYFFQFKNWHLTKTQIHNLLARYTAPEIEKLVSNILQLKEGGYALNHLLEIIFTYGLEHLCSLKDFNNTLIAKHYTRNEILAMIKHVDGCLRLHALKLNYADLKAMGHTPIKIKSIILQDLHQPNTFIEKNMNEYDNYLHEIHTERQAWFHQEVFSLFATTKEIDEQRAMYLEDLQSNAIKRA